MIDPARVGGSHRLSGAEAVEDLDFIKTVQVYAGVGPFGEHELQVEFDVAEFFVADKIGRAAAPPVENRAARGGEAAQARGAEQALPQHAARGEPFERFSVLSVPAREIFAVEERHPTVFEQIWRVAVRVAVVQLGEFLEK